VNGPAIADVPAAEVGRHPGLLAEILSGARTAALVRGVYPAGAMAALAARLEARGGAFPETSFPPDFHAHFLGQCLDLADPALDDYFEIAARFERAAGEAFAAIGAYRARVAGVLSGLARGARVDVPLGPGDRPYAAATIRWMEEGGFIPPHCEHEQARRPPYRHLRAVIRPDAVLSYYLMIQPPEGGGALCVSTLRWRDIDAARVVNGRSRVLDLVRARPHTELAPGAGDIVIVDGGSRFHWVAPCRGARLRWTIGGFVSPARAGGRLYTWS